MGEVSARDIVNHMSIKKGNLESLLEALRYFPLIIANWKIIIFK
ncbi:MAG: hypothetical protein QXL52_02835 [Nitrososphaerales archaeon]